MPSSGVINSERCCQVEQDTDLNPGQSIDVIVRSIKKKCYVLCYLFLLHKRRSFEATAVIVTGAKAISTMVNVKMFYLI